MKYSELGHQHRGDPCEEYPGRWIVYSAGKEVAGYQAFHQAWARAEIEVAQYDSIEQDEPIRISICWQASDNDPRIGQVWFTGFYQHGKFNQFGDYIS